MNMNAAAITDLKTEKITMHAENNRFCTWPKLLLGCSCTLDLQKIPQLWFFVSATCCCIKEYLTKYHKILQMISNGGFSYPQCQESVRTAM